MPRVTAAHELAVRSRIVEAAVRVFGEKGFHGATMQDVVHESGLSIGAIYTYFRSKDELFVAGCELTNLLGMSELAVRLAHGGDVLEKLAIAIGFFLDAIDDPNGGPGMASVLVSQWSRAEQEADVRAMLTRRRAQLEAAGQVLIAEAVAKGELPRWVDIASLTAAYILMLDGLLLWRVEQGDAYRRDAAIQRAMALLEPLIAASKAADRPRIPRAPEQPWSVHSAKVLAPRPERRTA